MDADSTKKNVILIFGTAERGKCGMKDKFEWKKGDAKEIC